MLRPVSIFDAASYILEKSPWTITQLELQELLYLSQMFHLGLHRTPLMSARFEARKYGPVNKTLYDELIKYGTDALISSNIPGDYRAIVGETHKSVLDFVVDKLSDRVGAELFGLTHRDGGAWRNTFNPHYPNVHIPDRLIMEEFVQKIEHIRNNPEHYSEAALNK